MIQEPTTLCGETIDSRRSLLASLWSFVTLLSAISFMTAFIFAIVGDTSNNYNNNNSNNGGYYNYNNNNNMEEEHGDQQNNSNSPLLAVTSRALAFSATWTGVLVALMSVFGTVVLGFQSPTGQYYTCCSSSVHRTTPLGLGSFIGSLLMLANLTLICAVLFGDFKVRIFSFSLLSFFLPDCFVCPPAPFSQKNKIGWRKSYHTLIPSYYSSS